MLRYSAPLAAKTAWRSTRWGGRKSNIFAVLYLAAKGAPGGQSIILSYSALRGGRSPGTRQGARGEAAGRVACFATLRLAAKGAPSGQCNIHATLRLDAEGGLGGQLLLCA